MQQQLHQKPLTENMDPLSKARDISARVVQVTNLRYPDNQDLKHVTNQVIEFVLEPANTGVFTNVVQLCDIIPEIVYLYEKMINIRQLYQEDAFESEHITF